MYKIWNKWFSQLKIEEFKQDKGNKDKFQRIEKMMNAERERRKATKKNRKKKSDQNFNEKWYKFQYPCVAEIQSKKFPQVFLSFVSQEWE